MPVAPVDSPEEILANPQLRARQFFLPLEGESCRGLQPAAPFRMSETPLRTGAPPELGRHVRPLSPRTPEPTAVDGPAEPRLPLTGLRVVDLTTAYAGPTVTRILAELGAEVIHVAAPQYPSRTDQMPPDGEAGEHPWNRGGYSLQRLLGKKEVTLNLTDPRGLHWFKRLVSRSDILVQNFTPRAVRKLGITYDEMANVKPDLIMVSLSGYGQDGPWSDYVAYGSGLEGQSGMAWVTGVPGGPPERCGMSYTDPLTGAFGAAAALVALRHRERTGRGQHIDCSELEATLCILPEPVLAASAGVPGPERLGNRAPNQAPHGVYPCTGDDQWIAVAVEDDAQWRELCRVLGTPELAKDRRFATLAGRLTHVEALDGALDALTRPWQKEALAAALQGRGIIAAPLRDARDLLLDPHLRQRRLYPTVPLQDGGPRPLPRQLPVLAEGYSVLDPTSSPDFGQHNREILCGLLGVADAEYAELERDAVTGSRPLNWREPDLAQPREILAVGAAREYDPDYRRRLGLA